jgi:hypothetical protein
VISVAIHSYSAAFTCVLLYTSLLVVKFESGMEQEYTNRNYALCFPSRIGLRS